MEVIVGNLQLYHIQTGFSEIYKQIHDANISVLGEVSKLYPDTHIIFYEVYGDLALLHETDNLLSTFFKSFEIVEGKSPVNSSPINNKPKIRADKKEVPLSVSSLSLVSVDDPDGIPDTSGETILKINYPVTRDVFHQLNEKFTVIADVVDCDPENLLEKQLYDRINKLDTLSKILLIKVLRGDAICG
ncbi:MAG: hypothetical protein KJ737_17165 [Proteobacteria bacterium]|nr:hypothetical protein [Pseudomonadota bacterium]